MATGQSFRSPTVSGVGTRAENALPQSRDASTTNNAEHVRGKRYKRPIKCFLRGNEGYNTL